MLNKKNRISNRNVIEQLFRNGKLYKNHFFVFKYEKAIGSPSQFAVSVSKKISKKAVIRNRLRRQVNDILRLNLNSLKQDFKALIIARPASQNATFQEISKSITTFFNYLESNAE